jgi:hypothetical protein
MFEEFSNLELFALITIGLGVVILSYVAFFGRRRR